MALIPLTTQPTLDGFEVFAPDGAGVSSIKLMWRARAGDTVVTVDTYTTGRENVNFDVTASPVETARDAAFVAQGYSLPE